MEGADTGKLINVRTSGNKFGLICVFIGCFSRIFHVNKFAHFVTSVQNSVNLSFCISADGKHLPANLGEPIFHICVLLHISCQLANNVSVLDSQLLQL